MSKLITGENILQILVFQSGKHVTVIQKHVTYSDRWLSQPPLWQS